MTKYLRDAVAAIENLCAGQGVKLTNVETLKSGHVKYTLERERKSRYVTGSATPSDRHALKQLLRSVQGAIDLLPIKEKEKEKAMPKSIDAYLYAGGKHNRCTLALGGFLPRKRYALKLAGNVICAMPDEAGKVLHPMASTQYSQIGINRSEKARFGIPAEFFGRVNVSAKVLDNGSITVEMPQNWPLKPVARNAASKATTNNLPSPTFSPFADLIAAVAMLNEEAQKSNAILRVVDGRVRATVEIT